MKHAGNAALDQLDGLLEEIRALGQLKEKSRGVFYRKAEAFLHFHEDPEGLFADLRVDGSWERLAVNSTAEKQKLLLRIQAVL